MARERTFNFILAHQIKPKMIEQSKRTVTINTTQKYMLFSIKDPEARLMVGQYLQFFVDKEKNVLGWIAGCVVKGRSDQYLLVKENDEYFLVGCHLSTAKKFSQLFVV